MRSTIRRPAAPALARLLLFPLLAAPAAAETTLLVDRFDDDPSASQCLDGVAADCSLRGAITTANAILGETVVVQLENGHYELTVAGADEDDNATGDLDIHRSLTLRGSFGSSSVEGGGSGGLDDRLLEVHGPMLDVVFEHVDFISSRPDADLHAIFIGSQNTVLFDTVFIAGNGTLAHGGGGLELDTDSVATVIDSVVADNNGHFGAGIVSRAASLLIQDSEIRNNDAADFGGGLRILESPAAGVEITTVERSTIVRNDARYGGGVLSLAGTEVRLLHSEVAHNSARFEPDSLGGGALALGELFVEGSAFVANEAVYGSAIYVDPLGGPTPKLDAVNVTISGNVADPGGAAVQAVDSVLELLFTTFADNGLDLYAALSNVQVTNSLFADDCQLPGGTVVTSGGGNLSPDPDCWNNLPAPGDLVVADLELFPLVSYDGYTSTHLPLPTSPAVGGAVAPCLGEDQRQLPRPIKGCDSGAVERQAVENLLFLDGFETGDASRWSAVAP